MAHYAFLDENNVVTEVITGVDENIIQTDLDGTQVGGSTEAWEDWYSNFRGQACKRTSINASAGKKKNPVTSELTDEPGFRKNFATVGSTYNETLDGFVAPRPNPHSAFSLNEETCNWDKIDLSVKSDHCFPWPPLGEDGNPVVWYGE
jgi:hypothetical protein